MPTGLHMAPNYTVELWMHLGDVFGGLLSSQDLRPHIE